MAPPSGSTHRTIDYFLFGYFLFQVPSTIFFDSQGVYPEWLYPGFLQSLRSHYLETYRDPYLANAWAHPWYLSICLVEHYIEVPFFFIASYAYYYGIREFPRVLMGALLYSAHTLTAVLSVFFMALGSEFNQDQSDVLAPRNFTERLRLCFAYSPFFIFSAICLFDCLRLLFSNRNKRD